MRIDSGPFVGSSCAIVGATLLVPLCILGLVAGPDTGEVPVDRCGPTNVADSEVQADALTGLWTRYADRGEGDPLRFWYFHGDGKGLYRYGKVGLAHTHSFDYSVDGDRVTLRFRKSGERHVTRAQIEDDGHGQTWLRFEDDPREAGARYRRVASDLDLAEVAADWWGAQAEAESGPGVGDRIWIDYRNYATGGAGFHMYQLAATAIDGRGVGWFHHGDFDDWTTESLTYRLDGGEIELFFDLREEPNRTAFSLDDGPDGRVLELRADPRDFWATHRYRDGGRSFGGSHAFDRVVGLHPRPSGDPSGEAP